MKISDFKNLIREMVSDEMGSNGMSMVSKGDDYMVSKVKTENYMFFSNLQQMKRQIELLMELDREEIEGILQNGHDWADDHVAVAKNNLDQVFDFMMNEVEDCGCDDM
jgi:hypothetical protein